MAGTIKRQAFAFGQSGPVLRARGFSEMKVIDLAALRLHARYCEGVYCCEPNGEVRVYPILFNARSARIILCRPCWEHENRHRHERGQELGCPEHWPTRRWHAAERYPEDRNEVPASPTPLACAA
jgi:hypothetical protein